MLRQARDARKMAINFPCFEKRKKHKDFRKTFINNKKINKIYFANSIKYFLYFSKSKFLASISLKYL